LTSRAAKIAHCGANSALEVASNFDKPLSGGDRDKHGCVHSAGYSWCAKTQVCIRPWEHNLTSRAAKIAHCGANSAWEFGSDFDESSLVGGDRDKLATAGVRLHKLASDLGSTT